MTIEDEARKTVDDETVAIARVIERLSDRFPTVPPPRIEEVVWAEHRQLDGRPVRNFVPILVEREAKTRLRELAASAPTG